MRTIQGPSLHLAQFSADQPPFNDLPSIAAWAASQGFKALQIPAWDERLFDLTLAVELGGVGRCWIITVSVVRGAIGSIWRSRHDLVS